MLCLASELYENSFFFVLWLFGANQHGEGNERMKKIIKQIISSFFDGVVKSWSIELPAVLDFP